MTKYGAKKTIVDGIKFDSKMESDFYLWLKELRKEGKIGEFELQPKFELQAAFKKRGINFRKIEYRADFRVQQLDGTEIIIDVKGMETADFKIKRKLFEKKFPQELKLFTKCPKKFGGGWIELDQLKQLRKDEKKAARGS
jgi:hypothetical protein